MNHIRKAVLVVYLVLVLAVCLYVPWSMHVSGRTLFQRYSFIWDPPNKQLSTVDTGRLICEIGLLSAALGIAWVLLPKKTSEKQ